MLANAASLLAQLTNVLNPDTFGKVNQHRPAMSIFFMQS
jgi:hypothetical protein